MNYKPRPGDPWDGKDPHDGGGVGTGQGKRKGSDGGNCNARYKD